MIGQHVNFLAFDRHGEYKGKGVIKHYIEPSREDGECVGAYIVLPDNCANTVEVDARDVWMA